MFYILNVPLWQYSFIRICAIHKKAGPWIHYQIIYVPDRFEFALSLQGYEIPLLFSEPKVRVKRAKISKPCKNRRDPNWSNIFLL